MKLLKLTPFTLLLGLLSGCPDDSCTEGTNGCDCRTGAAPCNQGLVCQGGSCEQAGASETGATNPTTSQGTNGCFPAGDMCGANGDCCTDQCVNFGEDLVFCADPCSDGSGCMSTCCVALESGGGACAPKVLCCEATGTACSQNDDCCDWYLDTAFCVNFGDEIGAFCANTCSTGGDCMSGCCAPTEEGDMICAPAEFCGGSPGPSQEPGDLAAAPKDDWRNVPALDSPNQTLPEDAMANPEAYQAL